MKGILFYLVFVFMTVICHGKEDTYLVRMVRGDVVYSQNGEKVMPNDNLKADLSLTFTPGSSVRLVDKKGLVYTYGQEGTVKIDEVVNVKRKSIIHYLFEALNSRQVIPGEESGVVRRSAGSPGIRFDILNADTHERFRISRIPANTVYYFSFGNVSDEMVYFNLIRVNAKAGEYIALFDTAVPVNSLEQRVLTECVFEMPAGVLYKFYLVASAQPIDGSELAGVIQENKPIKSNFPDATYVWKELYSY